MVIVALLPRNSRIFRDELLLEAGTLLNMRGFQMKSSLEVVHNANIWMVKTSCVASSQEYYLLHINSRLTT